MKLPYATQIYLLGVLRGPGTDGIGIDGTRIDAIRAILRNNVFKERLPAIREARERLLRKENLYAFLNRELDTL